MNLTSKSRYALKIMMDLAHYRSEALIRRSDVARRQGIPTDYLDQIMIRLRAAGLVESTRGRSGGYRLARDPEEINLWELFTAVEDNIYPVECVAQSCDFEASCVSRSAWEEIFDAVRKPLTAMSLGSIARKWADEHRMCPVGGVRECRAGGSSSRSEPTKQTTPSKRTKRQERDERVHIS
jgi:Rrf2 family protein